MANSPYQLVDEPRPGALAKVSVQPFWPLLAVMFSGIWLSWPWFVVNAFAMGSPTRLREVLVAIGGLVATVATLIFILTATKAGWIAPGALPYWLVVLTVVKLGFTYWLFVLQQRTFALYEYFGGTLANGTPVVVVGFLVERRIADHLPQFVLWLIA